MSISNTLSKPYNPEPMTPQQQGRKSILQKLGIVHHEYWPWWMLVAPVWPIWIWYCFRLRCSTWFTTVNPAIEDGGFMGESKIKILNIIPDDVKPKTLFVLVTERVPNENDLKNIFGEACFPLVAKPDIGGRGRKIKILQHIDELAGYHETVGEDYMLQEVIHAPLELGLFYVRYPNEKKGRIVSLASKTFLSVTGDGLSSIRVLMQQNIRARKQIERLQNEIDLDKVPNLGEAVLLEPIGNHCKGTAFINENHLITSKMNLVFDDIADRIGGFYYGRFDIRVNSWSDLEEGKNIFIMELNGLTSDPTHIFDPNYRLRDVYRTQFKHIRMAAKIARTNLAKGVKPTPLISLAKKSFAALKMM